MVIPQGVNIPMPKPFGGIPPAISKTPLGEDAAGGELITVSLVGEIGPITQYLEVLEVLDTATEKDQVRIVLDTPGGDVYTTQQIVGRMESCKAKVTTVASGLVASAGTFIWLYGHEQEVERWARFMFHSSLHGDWGKSLTIKENATELVKFMASILSDAEKRGILLAAEVQQILKGKADIELSASTVKARKRRRWVDEGDTPDQGDEGETEPEETETGDEGDEGGEEQPDNPSAKKLTKKKVIKKSKKRIASADDDGGDDDDEGTPPAETPDEGAGEGEAGDDVTEQPVEDMFDAICEVNGVAAPETTPEETTTEEQPAGPEGKKGGKKKTKKRKAEGEEGTPNPDEQPDEGGDDDDEGDDNTEGEEETEPPAAKKGKKKGKKRRAEGEGEGEGETETTETGDDEDDDDGEGDDDGEETNPVENPEESPVEDIFDAMCEENGVEAPPPEETPGEGDDTDGDDDGEDDDAGEGDDDDAGDGTPQAKCSKHGKKKKAKKPAKKRRAKEGEDITEGTDNDADKNSHLRKVPSSRYW